MAFDNPIQTINPGGGGQINGAPTPMPQATHKVPGPVPDATHKVPAITSALAPTAGPTATPPPTSLGAPPTTPPPATRTPPAALNDLLPTPAAPAKAVAAQLPPPPATSQSIQTGQLTAATSAAGTATPPPSASNPTTPPLPQPVNYPPTSIPPAAKVTTTPQMTVQGQLNNLLAADSPLMDQAKGQALQAMNARGLQNSSLAEQAGEQAAIAEALPIAQQDAQLQATIALNTQTYKNNASNLAQQLGNALNLSQTQQANWLQQAQVSLNDTLSTMSQTQSYTMQNNFLSSVNSLQTGLLNAITTIGSTQGLSATQQASAIQQLETQYQADFQAMTQYYGSPSNWDTSWSTTTNNSGSGSGSGSGGGVQQ